MAWTKYQKFLALMMVATGSINTLATKWADTSTSVGTDGKERPFDHPFLQAVGMFLGEFLCLLAFKALYFYHKARPNEPEPTLLAGNKNFSPLIFLAPAMCDMFATSIMYVGLNWTNASSFQMLRGAVIVFTGILSVSFLDRKLRGFEWTGIGIVIVGLVIVGVSDIVFGDNKSHGINKMIAGDLIIIIAQIITATQMVVEEKFVTKHKVPSLQVVGWEGLFGFITLSIILIPMNYIPVGQSIFKNPNGGIEDPVDGFTQIGNSWQVLVGVLGTIISIAFFNFAGISVTKEMSATTRMVLDSVRTLVVWAVSLGALGEKFIPLQLLGFVVLIVGMCLYNNIIIRPLLIKYGWIRGDAEDRLPVIDDNKDPLEPTVVNSVNA